VFVWKERRSSDIPRRQALEWYFLSCFPDEVGSLSEIPNNEMQ
jgi:hypothetical protein